MWPPPPDHPTDFNYDADTVTDNVTGHTWQRGVRPTDANWVNAVSYCSSLTLAGVTGWRLSSRLELMTLVDYAWATNGVYVAFPATPAAPFWSATPYINQAAFHAWTVDFGVGLVTTNDKAELHSVRCVLGAAAPAPFPARYTVGPNEALDTWTGLTWQTATSPTGLIWTDASAYCTGGWRLPSIKELLTLVDGNTGQPALDSGAFPGTSGGGYWSSTRVHNYPNEAWDLEFSWGTTRADLVQNLMFVRCVR